jgi:hypothetical protein
MIAAAYTEADHGHHLAAYVFAYAQEQNRPAQIKIRPKELGFDGDVYVYNYFSKTGKKVARDGEYDTSANYGNSKTNSAPPSGLEANIRSPVFPRKLGGVLSRPETTATYCLPSSS